MLRNKGDYHHNKGDYHHNKGDYHHNKGDYHHNKGDYHHNRHFTSDECGPCPQCLETYLKTELWSNSKCFGLEKEKEDTTKSRQLESELMLEKFHNEQKELINILPTFAKTRNDNIT